ncbi:MAG: hypothetical protein M3410_11610, partial [Acidobacteriota bacterium]|nr:hypothetical protein [Acidobacteriota bacterium]
YASDVWPETDHAPTSFLALVILLCTLGSQESVAAIRLIHVDSNNAPRGFTPVLIVACALGKSNEANLPLL